MPANKRVERLLEQLEDHQLEIFWTAIGILDEHRFLRDTSGGGLGKTFMQFVYAVYLSIVRGDGAKPRIGIVTNKDLIPKCHELAKRLGVTIVFLLTYETLRGTGKRCNHAWLTKTKNGYRPTKKLKRLLDEGILVVLDEHQKAKNPETWQHKACSALARAVHRSEKSVLSLLSNTPLGEERNMVSIPKLCGLLTSDQLLSYDSVSGQYEKKAFAQLEEYCLTINEKKTRSLVPTFLDDRNVQQSFDRLITKVLVPAVTINMREDYQTKNIIQNRFYSVAGEEYDQLVEASVKVSRMYGIAAARGGGMKGGEASKATAAYEGLAEEVKLNIIAREIIRLKKIDPRLKFLVFLRRTDSPERLKQLLAKYRNQIGVVNGRTKERENVRLKFQEPNDNMFIFIGNPAVCGAGIDLDDPVGDRPRVTFIIADPRFLSLYQASMRARRLTSKSDTYTIMVFIKGVGQETSVWKKIADHCVALSGARGKKTEFPTDMIDDEESPLMVEL